MMPSEGLALSLRVSIWNKFLVSERSQIQTFNQQTAR